MGADRRRGVRPLIFVDSSFWIAHYIRSDPRHPEAVELARRTVRESLVTTNHVVGETWTWLRKKGDHAISVAFLDLLEGGSLRAKVVSVSPEQEAAAWEWLRKHDERSYSFVDACSFAVMRSMRIPEALAFDGDFAAAGFRELRADPSDG